MIDAHTGSRAGDQLAILDRLMAAANASTDRESILSQSLAIVCEAYGAEFGAAYLLRADSLTLSVLQGSIAGHHALQRLSTTGRVHTLSVDRRQAAILGADELADEDLAGALGTSCEALACVPLLAHTEAIGVLLLGIKTPSIAEVDLGYLQSMGRAIGLAVENASLYQEMQQRLRESQTLYEISRAFSSTLDLDALLGLIVRSIVDTIDAADNCVLHLLEEATGELHPRALSFADEVRPIPAGRSHMRIGEGVAGIALAKGELVNIPDVASDNRFVRVGRVREFSSMVVAPLRMGERRLGTLSVDSTRTGAFSRGDERLIAMVATQAAAALENARLVHDLQQSLEDLKQTQAKLVQSAKLSAVGQLIAGVAHELNNPLTAVMGYAQLLRDTPGLDEVVSRDLGKIYTQAERAAKIVQNLLTFAREYSPERSETDVNEILERTLELRLYQLRVENIDVHTELAPQSLKTWADGNQLQQVFLNLINNAEDAMVAHRGGGQLFVRSSLRDGDIVVEVQDTGPGLSAKAQEHLFEPFFTTKEVGKGTGLGLSICFGIVTEHNGYIEVDSELGEGTTVRVIIPVQTQPDDLPENSEPPPPEVHDGKRILVVDDEPDVAGLVRRILQQHGHQVLVARDGQQALDALLGDLAVPVDAIISDVKMPGLNGQQFYERLCRDAPELAARMLFMTGDTLSPETRAFLQQVNVPRLPKPFSVDDLLRSLAELLGDKQDG